MQEEQTLIEAKELGLQKLRKSPFCDVSLSVKPHQIVAISGEHGSGKSALLLALSGYMKFTSGTLTIVDASLPHDLRKSRQYVGLGLFNGINEFYKTQTIDEVLMSELKLASSSPLFREQYKNDVKNREALQQYAYNVLAQWKVLSPRKTAIGELTPCERMRLAIALALLKKSRCCYLLMELKRSLLASKANAYFPIFANTLAKTTAPALLEFCKVS